MVKFIKKNKIKAITMITIIFLLLFGKIFINWFYNRSILESYVGNITVEKIDNDDKNYLIENGKQKWNLSENIIGDINKNPQNYRQVIINVTITNTSKYLYFDYGKFEPKHDETFKNMIVGKLDDGVGPTPINLEIGEGRNIGEKFIVKCCDKTNEEINKLAQKTRFTITGDIYYYLKGVSKNVCKSMEENHK